MSARHAAQSVDPITTLKSNSATIGSAVLASRVGDSRAAELAVGRILAGLSPLPLWQETGADPTARVPGRSFRPEWAKE